MENNNLISTRKAFGQAITKLGSINKNIVVLDAEVSNSTYTDIFKNKFPDRFFEMFIAEQNMISVALGMSKMGLIPFVSSFAAFLTRGFDQIRMSQYSNPNVKIIGSHCGVSIGQDGPSQMGLEDISMMRSILNSVVFYPCDEVSTNKLVELMANNNGLFYLRTTRKETPQIHSEDVKFEIGGMNVLKENENDKACIISSGITLHEALKAYENLKKENILTSVVDLYCVKPINEEKLKAIVNKTLKVIVVEDHYPYGGIGEAVKNILCCEKVSVSHLAVNKIPRSGKPEELLAFEEINFEAIIKKVKEII